MTERRKYVALVEDVRNTNGEVFIFSRLHASGEQLSSLSGVAAILRYNIGDLEEEEEEQQQQPMEEVLLNENNEENNTQIVNELSAFD